MRRLAFIRLLSLLFVMSGLITTAHAAMGKHSMNVGNVATHAAMAHALAHSHDATTATMTDAALTDDSTTSLAVDCCDTMGCSASAVALSASALALAPNIASPSCARDDLTAGLKHTPLLRPPR